MGVAVTAFRCTVYIGGITVTKFRCTVYRGGTAMTISSSAQYIEVCYSGCRFK